jgi:hypothetical protein
MGSGYPAFPRRPHAQVPRPRTRWGGAQDLCAPPPAETEAQNPCNKDGWLRDRNAGGRRAPRRRASDSVDGRRKRGCHAAAFGVVRGKWPAESAENFPHAIPRVYCWGCLEAAAAPSAESGRNASPPQATARAQLPENSRTSPARTLLPERSFRSRRCPRCR